MTIRALLLDLDGTLVRTNDAHVDSWLDAFEAFQYRVGRRRLEVEIGKGGDLLVPSILGPDVEEAQGEAMRKRRAELFKVRVEREGVKLFEGVDAFFEEVRRRGLRTAIATSASPDDLKLIERLSGRRFADMTDVITTKDDAEVSKPAPDILHAACEKLGEEPLAAMMIGDSLHDGEAARKAGIAFTGVATGFVEGAAFNEVGARFIAKDIAHLGASLGDALSAASASRVRFDAATLETMMKHALDAAAEGLARREAPFGAAVFDREGRLLATDHNHVCESSDLTAHAEMSALRRLAGQGQSIGSGGTLVSTLEPCFMCLGAAIETGIDVVVYGLAAPANGASSRVAPPRGAGMRLPRIRGGVASGRARDLFVKWLAEVGTESQRPYVEQLLAETE